jgi:hypothetical protein
MLPLGFRILGALFGERRVVAADRAFTAYSRCAVEAGVETEAYLSAFQFDRDFQDYVNANNSTRSYAGACEAAWLYWDIDNGRDLEHALTDARCLVLRLNDDLGVAPEELLIFFSGAKGFHIGVPTALWVPWPSADFHMVVREMATTFANSIGIKIDSSIYDKLRAFRAPNSRHPRTGLHKRRLSPDELLNMSLDAIRALAREPAPFDVPVVTRTAERAVGAWHQAGICVQKRASIRPVAMGSAAINSRLTRDTIEFIKNGAVNGERALRLFRAAANLAELGCTDALAFALLEDPARDTGLTPSEVKKQITDGLAHARGKRASDD